MLDGLLAALVAPNDPLTSPARPRRDRRQAQYGLLLAVLLPALAVTLALPPAVAAGVTEPWDGPPFSAEPVEIVRRVAAMSAPKDADVEVLLFDESHAFETGGEQTLRRHLVYRILSPAGVEGWSTIQMGWRPWHQERPELRARVIDAQGAARSLDPETIADSPAPGVDPDIFQDLRVLRAPLPATAIGSVVEEEAVVRDKQPMFDRGLAGIFSPTSRVPVAHARLTLVAPRGTPLAFASAPPPPVAPDRSEHDGRIELVFEFHDLAALKEIPEALPNDQPVATRIIWSTGTSWQDVASRYAQFVDGAIKGADMHSYVKAASGVSGKAAIDRILAAIRREVRYTGVEFGQAAIVPASPATVIKRRFGDCKDQAALLVAVLRALGRDASVALLFTGPGTDIDPNLPGLGLFNHAIVVVKDNPPIWIDPTDPYARAGELPIADQGRLALIASQTTSQLVTTPRPIDADNTDMETREFFLAEDGPARVVETTESTGAVEEYYRASFDSTDQTQLRERLTNYVKSTYAAKELGDFSFTAARDLQVPFRLRLEAKDAARGSTSSESAVVAIFLSDLLHRLPNSFFSANEKPRTADYVLAEPFVREMHYRIVPPPGYAPTGLPPARDERLGPAHLTTEFHADQTGEVMAVLRFQSGKARLSPSELADFKKALKSLVDESATLVNFEQVGEAHLAAGRVREALVEFEKLATLHPTEARHHAQRAKALLAGGLGEEARREARRAIEVEPASAQGWEALSWCLQHDAVGRKFHKGFDLAGAVAAYRKAKELDPKNAFVRANLAILLTYDEKGAYCGKHADLAGAIEEFQARRRDLDDKDYDKDLLKTLVRARRFAEAKELATSMPVSQERDAAVIAAIAMTDGAAAALAEARRRLTAGEERRKAVLSAASTLLDLRAYPQASDLQAEGANGADNSAGLLSFARTLRDTRPFEKLALPEEDPASVFRRLIIASVASEDPPAEAAKLLASDFQGQIGAGTGRDSWLALCRELRGRTSMEETSPLASLDVWFATIRIAREGNDEVGYKLRVQTTAPFSKRGVICYVTKADGVFRIVGFGGACGAIGREVLRRVDRGDLAGARTLLNWFREDNEVPGGDDPLWGDVFPRVWAKGSQGGPEAIRGAAACLLVHQSQETEAIAPLRAALAANQDPGVGTYLKLALVRALLASRRPEEALPLAQELLAQHPESATAFHNLIAVERQLHRLDDATATAQARLRRLPDDVETLRALFYLDADKGSYAAASDWLARLVERGKAEARDYNSLAWAALFRGGMGEQAILDAQQGVDISPTGANYSLLHTLASAFAEQGKTGEAYKVILIAMDVPEKDEPSEDDWYVFGRLAEAYGLPAVARELYGKISPQKNEEARALSTFELARRRLAILQETGSRGHGDRTAAKQPDKRPR